jgi:hypothetical protein
VSAYVITNPVPTPEEMGEILGLSPDRVKAVRAIMSRPGPAKTSGLSGKLFAKATKKTSRVRRTAAKKAKK